MCFKNCLGMLLYCFTLFMHFLRLGFVFGLKLAFLTLNRQWAREEKAMALATRQGRRVYRTGLFWITSSQAPYKCCYNLFHNPFREGEKKFQLPHLALSFLNSTLTYLGLNFVVSILISKTFFNSLLSSLQSFRTGVCTPQTKHLAFIRQASEKMWPCCWHKMQYTSILIFLVSSSSCSIYSLFMIKSVLESFISSSLSDSDSSPLQFIFRHFLLHIFFFRVTAFAFKFDLISTLISFLSSLQSLLTCPLPPQWRHTHWQHMFPRECGYMSDTNSNKLHILYFLFLHPPY